MIKFPDIDPVIISFGKFAISWYSLAYVFSIISGTIIAKKLIISFNIPITSKQIDSFVNWLIIGVIVGGRLGYVLIYDPIGYLSDPISILKTYEGGMSFHGGLFGVITTTYYFSKKNNIPFLQLMDIIASMTPIGIFCGRLANFINAELYGRVTNVPWAIIFPNSDMLPRHPSQIYEAILEGALIGGIMIYSVLKHNTLSKRGRNSAIFLICYAVARIYIENFREPDWQLGFIYANITMGQILCLPMLIVGIYLLYHPKISMK